MNKFVVLAAALWPALSPAAVLNVEYQFTPFVGDVAQPEVESVPGKARVFLNNVPVAEQEIGKRSLPVLFSQREVAPAVWLPVQSLGGAVRKGKNTIRIEFEPSDPKLAYQARLQWASVTDQVTRQSSGNTTSATNQADQGLETKKSQGKIVLEKQFVADFAADRPWHHYPPVTALTDDDRQKLVGLVTERAAAFKPNFDKLYKLLDGRPELQLGEIRKAKCLDKAHAAGVRITAPAAADIEFATTGSAAVVVSRKNEPLYPLDPNSFTRIKGDNLRLCAGMTLSIAYPAQLVVAKSPAGSWEIAF